MWAGLSVKTKALGCKEPASLEGFEGFMAIESPNISMLLKKADAYCRNKRELYIK